MVKQRAKAIQKTEDTSWIPAAVELTHQMAEVGLEITTATFGDRLVVSMSVTENRIIAENRLRLLTQKGWLYMGMERDADDKFVQFVWTVR